MLTVDIGNSGIKWGIWQEDQLVLAEDGVYEKASIKAVLDDVFSGAPKQDEVWVSCVAGKDVEQALTEWMQHEWSVEPVFLRTRAELGGVQNMYHPGDELIYILEGRLRMEIVDEVYILEEGDSLCFKSHLPHRWENIGADDAKVIWTLSPFTII